MAAKAELLNLLTRQCGFSAVLFEAGIYDFLHYQQQLATRQASLEMLGGAVGGLWSGVDELVPLIQFLHQTATDGRMHIGGIDVQLGSATARYAQRDLPGALAAVLPPDRRHRCFATIGRHNRWEYNQTVRFDAAEKSRLSQCIAAIEERVDGADAPDLAVQVASYRDYLRINDSVAGARTDGMLRNLLWYRDHWPAGTRIVVWTASVHGVRAGIESGSAPLGARLSEQLGPAIASIGFSAAGGSYGRAGRLSDLEAAREDSLEALALAGSNADLGVLDHAALRAAGTRAARAIDYETWQERDWSRHFDALVVVRQERPIPTP